MAHKQTVKRQYGLPPQRDEKRYVIEDHNPFEGLVEEPWTLIGGNLWEFSFSDGTILLVETGICGLTAFGHDDNTRKGCRMVHCKPNASGFPCPIAKETWVVGSKEAALKSFIQARAA